MSDLTISVDDLELEATWTDEAPETRRALENALPVAGDAVRWGDELYIDAALDAPLESEREVVPEGAITYWPAGNKLCLFWGPTPASVEDEPRAAAPVSVVARVTDVDPLAAVDGSARLELESAEDS
ncbi:cyclophilin-like family protein [Halopiger xanaduensis]|uniref:Cyclophilin TM1367-like domain-containing protein n=1 Tax=Halopiger xanaduensis (strain DSM 18323 / JCM 14033 / SH-6) TaxID=797210 RepID=F8DAZ7_HALXS|nr:cyclophilin-like family protein [Halopiger xanaduensis]AEH38239.1 protein of unknown function DUF369 [Halopiger xanaduensis SH-6]